MQTSKSSYFYDALQLHQCRESLLLIVLGIPIKWPPTWQFRIKIFFFCFLNKVSSHGKTKITLGWKPILLWTIQWLNPKPPKCLASLLQMPSPLYPLATELVTVLIIHTPPPLITPNCFNQGKQTSEDKGQLHCDINLNGCKYFAICCKTFISDLLQRGGRWKYQKELCNLTFDVELLKKY